MDSLADPGSDSRRRQRKTRDLGFNRSRDDPAVYDYIEKVLGISKKMCGRGARGASTRFGLVHQGPNPVPIREFHLHKAFVDSKAGKVVILSKDGLQGACIKCDRAYRRARLDYFSKKYDRMTPAQIYDNYRKTYRADKRCSRCHQFKAPEEFPISRGMETGLHNVCKECAMAYSESVGTRWAIFSPDGHHVIDITDEDSCRKCKSKEKLHKDHIWPLAKGGTDNAENIQVLCGEHNLAKLDTIDPSYFRSLDDVADEMICGRYRTILSRARAGRWSILKFDLEISSAVRVFLETKCEMTDDRLRTFFIQEKRRNNRKHNVEHAMRKFREYCGEATLDVSGALEDVGQ